MLEPYALQGARSALWGGNEGNFTSLSDRQTQVAVSRERLKGQHQEIASVLISPTHARGFLADLLQKAAGPETKTSPGQALPDTRVTEDLRRDVRSWVNHIFSSAGIPPADLPLLVTLLSAASGKRENGASYHAGASGPTPEIVQARFKALTEVADPSFFRALAEEAAQIHRNGGTAADRLKQFVSGTGARRRPRRRTPLVWPRILPFNIS